MNPPTSAAAKVADISNSTEVERPLPSPPGGKLFGSDAVADALRSLNIPFIALNPGASYRGLHDSIVNYLGNETPQMLLCLHEENAVAIAHGYAKVTGKPMAAAVHSNVGLMHATMAVFNAWCDRMPVVIMGATGVVDAMKRRPWIEWIHTARDQGALVRDYTKWDDQPASPGAARESILRGYWMSSTAPMGPVYINLDVELQESPLLQALPPIEAQRYMPPVATAPSAESVKAAAALLRGAKNIVILAGRCSRSVDAWNARVALAEGLNAKVITELKIGASFPTAHPLHAGAPGAMGAGGEAAAALKNADVIVSLDWVDLAGIIKTTFDGKAPTAQVIQASVDYTIHRGWSMDYQGLPPVDVILSADPDAAVPLLIKELGLNPTPKQPHPKSPPPDPVKSSGDEITVDEMALTLRRAVGDRPTTLTHLSLSWNGATWPFAHPLDFLGSEGGGGVGGGPGNTVGSALALRGSGRLPIGICGDGDFMMSCTALWTAVHYRIPMLIVVCNNRSFFNDELHQERVARMRVRPVENRWIGQRVSDPDVDMAQIARAQGAVGLGPVITHEQMEKAFKEAIETIEKGGVAVVDVRVKVGYAAAAAAMTQTPAEKAK
ncbi:MAG: thiamine pyrophosphate-binding protein [Rhizobiales bacterium]|nr:thiamine pyrophosphate-binding protein [Hyphomicrobiales bacterium]